MNSIRENQLPVTFANKIYFKDKSLDSLNCGESIEWCKGKLYVESVRNGKEIFGNALWIKGTTTKKKGLLQLLSNQKIGKPCFKKKIDYVVITSSLKFIYLSLQNHAISSSYQNGQVISLSTKILEEVFAPIKKELKKKFF